MNKKELEQKTAVALSYDVGDTAPKILATGKGYVAERMIEVAKQENVPLHQDAKLANTLSKLEVSGYNFIFDSNIEEYTILLKDITKELEVTADSTDKNATVTINNVTKYKEGNNIIEILVVAENGDQKTYKINAINLNKEEVKDNNVVFYVIILLETLLIIGAVITTLILKKKGMLLLKK